MTPSLLSSVILLSIITFLFVLQVASYNNLARRVDVLEIKITDLQIKNKRLENGNNGKAMQ